MHSYDDRWASNFKPGQAVKSAAKTRGGLTSRGLAQRFKCTHIFPRQKHRVKVGQGVCVRARVCVVHSGLRLL